MPANRLPDRGQSKVLILKGMWNVRVQHGELQWPPSWYCCQESRKNILGKRLQGNNSIERKRKRDNPTNHLWNSFEDAHERPESSCKYWILQDRAKAWSRNFHMFLGEASVRHYLYHETLHTQRRPSATVVQGTKTTDKLCIISDITWQKKQSLVK